MEKKVKHVKCSQAHGQRDGLQTAQLSLTNKFHKIYSFLLFVYENLVINEKRHNLSRMLRKLNEVVLNVSMVTIVYISYLDSLICKKKNNYYNTNNINILHI